MIDLSALTDHDTTPSSRFRVRALLPELRQRGIEVTDIPRRYSTELSGLQFPNTRICRDPRKAALALCYHMGDIGHALIRTLMTRHFSGSWVSREIVTGHQSWESLLKKPIYYDIDDAIFLRGKVGRSGIDHLIRNAACVFAGNSFLADYCSDLSDRVMIVPTAVDTRRFQPGLSWRPGEQFKVVWSGTSTSFPYLQAIEPALVSFFTSATDAKLHVYSNRYPTELRALQKYIQFDFWTQEAEVAQIQDADVGIMPIPDTDWARGKCSYKMLLYAACGVPCIVSNFGMNAEVLAKGAVGVGCSTADHWRDALEHAYQQRDRLRDLYPDGAEVVKRHYALDTVANTVSCAIHSCSI
jgi:glycosyltransferase involved in cell wall biosynthesis